jgi:hypothetical protein
MKLKTLLLISYLCFQEMSILSSVNLPPAIPVSNRILDNNSSISPLQNNLPTQSSVLQNQNLNNTELKKNSDVSVNSANDLFSSLPSPSLPSKPMVDNLPESPEKQNQETINSFPDNLTYDNAPNFKNELMSLSSENPSLNANPSSNMQLNDKNFTNELNDIHEIIEDLKISAASQSLLDQKINQTRFLRKKFKSLLKSLIDKLKSSLTEQNFKIFENYFKIINESYESFKNTQSINDLNEIEKSTNSITLLSGSKISTLSEFIE